jgi:5'-nucleotidase
LPDASITITEDKSLVYGRVLVDDFPPYVDRWLKWRKNGVAIMPAAKYNETYIHPNMIRYDGSYASKKEVRAKMEWAFDRETD